MKDWEDMSLREQDVWIGEHVCGRKWYREERGAETLYYLYSHDPHQRYRDYKGVEVSSTEAWQHQGAWWDMKTRYVSDMNDAFEMEEAIHERGLTRKYTEALKELVGRRSATNLVLKYHLFALIHATPEQRAHAAFLTLRSGKES